MWQLFLWSIILGWCFFSHSDHLFNADEGVILDGAWNLFNGRQLYSDFLEIITPGSFYLLLFIWKIFGVTFWSAKIVSVLLLFFSAVGIYFIAQKITKNNLNFLAPVFFCLVNSRWAIINHNFYSLPFAIWAIYFLLLGLDNNKIKNFIFSGLLSGVTILFLQTRGIAVGAAIFLFLLYFNKLKMALIYFILTIIPLFVLLLWPIQIIIDDLVLFPFNNYGAANKVPLTFLLIIIIIFSLIIYFFHKEKNSKLSLLFTTQIFLLLTTISRPDYYHLIIALAPTMALLGIIIDRIKNKNKSIYYKFTNYCLIAMITSLLIAPALDSFFFQLKPFYSASQEIFIFIEKNCPGKYIYAGPFWPSIYFESRKLNATPYPWLITSFNTPEQFLNAQKNFKDNNPSCAILIYPKSLENFKHNPNNLVENYIRNNYHLIYFETNIYIYKQ